jgi:UDP-glucose 4-epimerase
VEAVFDVLEGMGTGEGAAPSPVLKPR